MEQNTPKFVANPHALLIDNLVTEVVFMQDYDEDRIAEELANHTYDEVVRWEDYGWPLYVSYMRRGEHITMPKPDETSTWVFNVQFQDWERPVPHPQDGYSYIWNEKEQSWTLDESRPYFPFTPGEMPAELINILESCCPEPPMLPEFQDKVD